MGACQRGFIAKRNSSRSAGQGRAPAFGKPCWDFHVRGAQGLATPKSGLLPRVAARRRARPAQCADKTISSALDASFRSQPPLEASPPTKVRRFAHEGRKTQSSFDKFADDCLKFTQRLDGQFLVSIQGNWSLTFRFGRELTLVRLR